MPIDLGLSRVAALLSKLGNPHLNSNFIHVSGTNGKGSVCAYLTSLLLANTKNEFKIGKFTSPHLLVRSDSVTLNNVPIAFDIFAEVEQEVEELNKKFDIGATEFEKLTATAFQIFHLEKVDLAVIEVGLGGRLDSTNIIEGAVLGPDNKITKKGVLVTGITKIGMDHENLLGSTLKEIAGEKAGIIKSKIPNVVDGTNNSDVLDVIQNKASELNCDNNLVDAKSDKIVTAFGEINRNVSPLNGYYQLQNLSVSLKILDIIFPFLKKNYSQQVNFSLQNVIKGVKNVEWPGRLQNLHLKYSPVEPTVKVLLDGAHNGQAATELSRYLMEKYNGSKLTFIIAVTEGKDLTPLLSTLISPFDKVVVTRFGAVENMPWIKATDPEVLKEEVLKYTKNVIVEPSVEKTFDHVGRKHSNVVVCGSLYLVSEVLRLHQKNSEKS